jgi:hypothetical protein
MTTIHDIVMGPALESHPCGGCTACCTVLNVSEPDLVKPAGQTCMHCTGMGCSIHSTRPNICREWNCAYRRIETMPIETRPDRCGVVFTIDRQAQPQTPFEKLYFVGRAVDDPEKLKKQPVLDIAYMLAHGPLPIFASWGDQMEMIFPRKELAEAILNPAAATPALAEEGREWMAKYEPFAKLADQVAPQAA